MVKVVVKVTTFTTLTTLVTNQQKHENTDKAA